MGNRELDSGDPRAGFIYYRPELNSGDGTERAGTSREKQNRIGKGTGEAAVSTEQLAEEHGLCVYRTDGTWYGSGKDDTM